VSGIGSELSPRLQSQGRVLITKLHMLVRTLRFHDVNNQALLVASEHLRDTINALWAAFGGSVRLQLVDCVAYLNDHRLRIDPATKSQVDFLQEEFDRRELGGLAFTRPVDAAALREFMHVFMRSAESPEGISALKASLEQFRDLALELLDPRHHVDEMVAEDDVRVDRKTFGLQSYARAIVAVRQCVEALQEGRDVASIPLNVTRTVQDLVDVGTERVNFLLKLGAIKHADDYAFNHAANTCVLSIVIGRALGIERLMLVDLGLSALFADIGFAMLPPELVDRERQITAEERRELQSAMIAQARSLFSGDRLSESMMRRLVVAYEHHVPYRDPTGTRTYALHPFSRIVAVADAFDALTTRRAWREGYPADEALKILDEEAGERFDPLVVKVFTNLMGMYPLGRAVRLRGGEVAVVYHNSNDPRFFAQPWIRVLFDAHGDRVRRTVIRNLADEPDGDREIVGLVRPGEVPDLDVAIGALF
jgi:HD-GYP domain-containing protein (c-di-GMP phosphodiesterase class II)